MYKFTQQTTETTQNKKSEKKTTKSEKFFDVCVCAYDAHSNKQTNMANTFTWMCLFFSACYLHFFLYIYISAHRINMMASDSVRIETFVPSHFILILKFSNSLSIVHWSDWTFSCWFGFAFGKSMTNLTTIHLFCEHLHSFWLCIVQICVLFIWELLFFKCIWWTLFVASK